MSKIKHDEARRRRDVKREYAKIKALGQVEQHAMSKQGGEIKVLVFGYFSKPKKTRDFWVILPYELDVDVIRERINQTFGEVIK